MPELFSGQDSQTLAGGGSPPRRKDRFYIFNNSGEDIPSYGAMELSTEKVVLNGVYCWNVIKPTGDSLQNVVFNEGHPLADQKFGYGTTYATNGGIIAAYDGTAPVVGDSVGTASGLWTVKAGNSGFTALNADTTNKVCAIQPAGGGASISIVQATADGANGVVPVKTLILKATPASSPNYDQAAGDPVNVFYFKI